MLPLFLPFILKGKEKNMGNIYIKNKWLPYLLILPTILLICIFKIYPIFDSVIQGFLSKDGELTINNYELLFADKIFWESLAVTVKFNVIIIPFQIIVAFAMAMIVNVKVKGIELFRTIFYLPFCISLTVATVIWQTMLNVNNGVMNSILGIFGIGKVGFLIDKKWALLSIILIASWRGCAYWMMFFLAGLKGIDTSVYESAKIDGSGFFSTLFRITLPLLKNTMIFVIIANTTANF